MKLKVVQKRTGTTKYLSEWIERSVNVMIKQGMTNMPIELAQKVAKKWLGTSDGLKINASSDSFEIHLGLLTCNISNTFQDTMYEECQGLILLSITFDHLELNANEKLASGIHANEIRLLINSITLEEDIEAEDKQDNYERLYGQGCLMESLW